MDGVLVVLAVLGVSYWAVRGSRRRLEEMSRSKWPEGEGGTSPTEDDGAR